jgi:aerobic carbon-monoxide dehydrogenase small subunit
MGMQVSPRVNGTDRTLEIEPHELLLDVLRERLGLTGAKRSCDVQVCGTCTVLVDGLPVSSCTYLAAEADGREVTTIEGLRDTPEHDRIADAFAEHAAVQCGFCSPAMVLTVHALQASGDLGDEEAVRRELAGVLCRCTGYRAILEAVADVASDGAAR